MQDGKYLKNIHRPSADFRFIFYKKYFIPKIPEIGLRPILGLVFIKYILNIKSAFGRFWTYFLKIYFKH
jgi:hypothetical protein